MNYNLTNSVSALSVEITNQSVTPSLNSPCMNLLVFRELKGKLNLLSFEGSESERTLC